MVLRVFNHYLHRQALRQVFFDVGLILSMVMAVVLGQGPASHALMPFAASHSLSLAGGMFVINFAAGFYQNSHNRSMTATATRALLGLLFGLPLAYAIFSLLPADPEPRNLITRVAMAAVAAVLAHRVYAAHVGLQSRNRTRILIFGTGAVARAVGISLTAANPHAQIIGYFAGPNEAEPQVPLAEIIASTDSLIETARRMDVAEIVVALPERRGGSMPLRQLLDCKLYGINVVDISSYFERTLTQINIDHVNPGWLIFGDGFNQGLIRSLVKRAFDLIFSALLLLLSLPLMLAAALWIKLDSPGPVLYQQQRVGLNGKIFRVIKFRSMRADAEKDGKPRWASIGDDRVTKVGRFIRKLRIDELPQLVNVLRGEMSLVGPRPERQFFVDELIVKIPYFAVRHSVKPGVTGWAQVRYEYGSTVEDSIEKLQYDMYYVKNHSLFLDLLIILETVAVVLTGKGAR
jgi:sugar transferase (PEP-CTERM system associated)